MSAGWVLVQTAPGATRQVIDALLAMPNVEQAEPTAGAYDIVARVADTGPQVRSAKRVLQAALRVPGVALAVCCHDGEGRVDETIELSRTIDLNEPAALAPVR